MSKKCLSCDVKFDLTKQELSLLKKMDLPEPKLCPTCRSQRRWVMRNQSKLFKRKCDFTGKEIVSLYTPDSKHKVYKEDIWWSDKWDAMDYGRDFDFSRPFFEQFKELQLDVPRRGMHQDGTSENCEYTTFGMNNKDCYLAFACFGCENVYYSTWAMMSRESIDCLLPMNSELVYECIHCLNSYKCFYCKNCNQCTECYLIEDCNNCQNCIGCKNLANKKYYIYNKKSTKEEYEKLKDRIEKDGFKDEKEKFDKWKLTQPTRYAHIINSQNCDGDYIYNGKNCHNCFGVLAQGAEDSCNCHMTGAQAKEVMDCNMSGAGSELIYEMQATTAGYMSAFVNFCKFSKYVYYCDSISNCENCFGCVGLKNQQFCIFNKQYSKEEYNKLKNRIIDHMKKTGEWGENFPSTNSPFPYNHTLAQDYFPLDKAQARKLGYPWHDDEQSVVSKKTSKKLEKNIAKINESILEEVLTCENCSKDYRIIPQELRLYKILKVAIPSECPDCRYNRKMKEFSRTKLYERKCMNKNCDNKFKTIYTQKDPEIVYCESCYQKIVI
ncbi:MAG: hypothetical protein ABH810_01150 [bacterium]